MDERAINGAAIEAISDLELDCEIKEVRERAGKGEWCIQFSGKYGQFCDEFKNQFGEESSPQVIREKIKRHLIKQVNKIRSGTGRRRKMTSAESGERQRPEEGGILAAPLKIIGEVFDRVAGVAGEVVSQASAVAETVGQTVAAADISPVRIEVRSTTREVDERATAPARKERAKPSAKKSVGTKSAAGRAAKGAAKQAKKTAKAAKRPQKKTTGKAVKKAKKSARRVK